MGCCEKKTLISTDAHDTDCMICGRPLRYSAQAEKCRCSVCGKDALSEAVCEAGHFVCDDCHRAGLDTFFVPFLLESTERCPQTLLEHVMRLPQVHMHGPEHHAIVPCVLLTAYRNCGGTLTSRPPCPLHSSEGNRYPAAPAAIGASAAPPPARAST